MKIIGIVGSPRVEGNNQKLVKEPVERNVKLKKKLSFLVYI